MTRSQTFLALAAVAAAGCVTVDRGHFAALSTAPLPLASTLVRADVEGRACGGVFQDPLRRAVADALAKAPGANALVDVRYRFGDLCMIVNGRAVRVP